MACSPYRRLVVLDVGANDGSSFLGLAKAMPWISVFAFEPTPELVAKLKERSAGLRNYHIVSAAVGEAPGMARFNVTGHADWGCSSLLQFSDGLEQTWPGRTDFQVTQTIDVAVVRLDGFLDQERIRKVDFLHVDAQGTDLQVLRSLGRRIADVSGGVIEVPQRPEVMLYKGQHTREEAYDFLQSNGFEVWNVVPQENEDNLFFRRPRK